MIVLLYYVILSYYHVSLSMRAGALYSGDTGTGHVE